MKRPSTASSEGRLARERHDQAPMVSAVRAGAVRLVAVEEGVDGDFGAVRPHEDDLYLRVDERIAERLPRAQLHLVIRAVPGRVAALPRRGMGARCRTYTGSQRNRQDDPALPLSLNHVP